MAELKLSPFTMHTRGQQFLVTEKMEGVWQKGRKRTFGIFSFLAGAITNTSPRSISTSCDFINLASPSVNFISNCKHFLNHICMDLEKIVNLEKAEMLSYLSHIFLRLNTM